VSDEAEIPIFRVVQICETAVDERSNKIDGERRALIASEQKHRIGFSRLGRELGSIDDITAVRRQRNPVASLGIGRPGLGVLPSHATHSNDRFLETVGQHEAHLQQNLESLGDRARFTVVEILGAVAALQEKAFASLRGRELFAQSLDFPRDHDRRQTREFRHGVGECG